jgi:hypothetical protein
MYDNLPGYKWESLGFLTVLAGAGLGYLHLFHGLIGTAVAVTGLIMCICGCGLNAEATKEK